MAGEQKRYYVYILASSKHGALYIGITSDLIKRGFEHRSQKGGGFAGRYDIHRLVYFEIYDDPENAILREKRLKAWKRD